MKTEIVFYIFLNIILILGINSQIGPNKFSQTKRTLILVDDMHLRDTHSTFFKQLHNMGYELDFQVFDDTHISLTGFGEYLYSNIIIMAPSIADTSISSFSIQEMLKFFDSGHDIMIFADKTANKYIRKLVNEFGVDFDDYNSLVRDSMYSNLLKDKLNPQLISMRNDEIIATNKAVPTIAPNTCAKT